MLAVVSKLGALHAGTDLIRHSLRRLERRHRQQKDELLATDARQEILDIRPFVDNEGVSRCHIVLEPTLVPVYPRPHRPFQGWRYLVDHEAPKDLKAGAGALAEMPEALRRELSELGLL